MPLSSIITRFVLCCEHAATTQVNFPDNRVITNFLYATVGNHSYPHEPSNFGRNVVLEPGTDFTFEMKLPQALEAGQEVIIRCPSLNLQAVGLAASGVPADTETGR